MAQSLFKNSDESIKRAYYRLLNDTDRKVIMANHYSRRR